MPKALGTSDEQVLQRRPKQQGSQTLRLQRARRREYLAIPGKPQCTYLSNVVKRVGPVVGRRTRGAVECLLRLAGQAQPSADPMKHGRVILASSM